MKNINTVMALFVAGVVVNGLRQLLDWSVVYTGETMSVMAVGLWGAALVMFVRSLMRADRPGGDGETPE